MIDKREVHRCKNTIRDMTLRNKELTAVLSLINKGHSLENVASVIQSRIDFCNKEIRQAKIQETELTGKVHKL